jgi:hypothetical protein
MKNSITQKMALGLIIALKACGGDPANQPVAPIPPPPTQPAPPVTVNPQQCFVDSMNLNRDLILECVMPEYQRYFGSIRLQSQVSIGGTVIPAGTYTWMDMYSRIQQLAVACGCAIQGVPQVPGLTVSGFMNLNYSQFSTFLGVNSGVANAWGFNQVRTESGLIPVDYLNGQYVMNFNQLYNMLVTLAYNFYSQYYYVHYYPVQFNWPTQIIWPGFVAPQQGFSVGGGFQFSNGNGFSLTFGGFYSSNN